MNVSLSGIRSAARSWLQKPDVRLGVALFLVFWMFYGIMGELLQSTVTHPYEYYDVLFELDTPRMTGNMLNTLANHADTTERHPLYVIFVAPLCFLIRLIPGARMFDNALVIAVTAGFGALSAVMWFALFRRMGGNRIDAIILTVLSGMSMSHMVLSMVPETASLAIFGHSVTYLLFWTHVHTKPLRFRWWVLAGVFSFGVTVTNVVPTLICYAFAQWKGERRPPLAVLTYTGCLLLAVLGLAALLALLQKSIYPSASLFFVSLPFTKNRIFLNFLALQYPLMGMSQLIKQFVVMNIVGGVPQFVLLGQLLPTTTFTQSWHFLPGGYAALAVLAILILLARGKQEQTSCTWFRRGLGWCFLFYVILHAVYGPRHINHMEYFLYSGNVTFCLVVLLFAKCLNQRTVWIRATLLFFVVMLGINNLSVMRLIRQTYDRQDLADYAREGWAAHDATWRHLADIRARYHDELSRVKAQHGLNSISVPRFDKYFLFGAGARRKMLYIRGQLIDIASGKLVRAWDNSTALIVAPARSVALRTNDGRFVYIEEDEQGVFVEENGRREAITVGPCSLPLLDDCSYPLIMSVLRHEILFNMVDGTVRPNILTDGILSDSDRDAAMRIVDNRKSAEGDDDRCFAASQSDAQSGPAPDISAHGFPLSAVRAFPRGEMKRLRGLYRTLAKAGIPLPESAHAARLVLYLDYHGSAIME